MTDWVSSSERVEVKLRNCDESSSFVWYRFPPEVIMLAVRWYLRYGLFYRHIEELLDERGIEDDHGRIEARLRPMRCQRTERSASIVIRGHAFIQNLRRSHYKLVVQPATTVYDSRQLSMNSPKRSDLTPTPLQ